MSAVAPHPDPRPRVVIIGSGFGGLFGARALADDDVRVTVVARTSHHLFQPLLYQVATGILSPGEIAPSTREVLADQRNAEVVLGEVTHVDLEARTVHARMLGREASYSYDHLIVAAGSNQSWFGHDEFAQDAPGMKSIDDALEQRGRIYGAFELAELAAAGGRWAEADRLMTFVVVGAGPTGVEMAGQLAEMAHHTLRREFRHIDPTRARIILLDGADAVLGTFAPVLQRKSKAKLESLGIEVRLGAMVVDVDTQGLEVRHNDGSTERIDAITKVWAAGVQASPLARDLADQVGLQVDRQGRLPVRSDLTLPGHPEVFVVGDMVVLDDLPGVAQVAIQQVRHATRQIRRMVRGGSSSEHEDFSYFDKGNMASISRFWAVAEIGQVKSTGPAAWVLWLGVHLVYLIGFKSQVTTLLHWLVTFAGNARSQRTTSEQQVFARLAMQRSGTELIEQAGRRVLGESEDETGDGGTPPGGPAG